MEAPAQDIPYTTAHGGAYFNNAGAAVVDPQSVQAAHAAAQEAVGRARAQAAAVQQQQQLAVARSASCGSLANTGMSRNDSAADLLSGVTATCRAGDAGRRLGGADAGSDARKRRRASPQPPRPASGSGLCPQRQRRHPLRESGAHKLVRRLGGHGSRAVADRAARERAGWYGRRRARSAARHAGRREWRRAEYSLPPAALNCPVQLTDGQGNATNILPMHRIPFWLATEDGTGNHRAVVLYVQVRPPPAAQFFPAMVSSSRAASGAC